MMPRVTVEMEKDVPARCGKRAENRLVTPLAHVDDALEQSGIRGHGSHRDQR